MTKTNEIFEECLALVDPKIREEVRARADALYPIHEDDLSIIRNIREYKQDAYTRGYNAAKKELGWHEYPADPPEKSGEYIVIVDAGGTWHSSWWSDEDKAFTVWDDHITVWMPVPEYIPKK